MNPGRKALLIDDSAMLLRYAVSVLGSRLPDLEVVTARRGGEGFYQADKLRPDLILLSLSLPDTPGEKLCRRLERHPGTAFLPVILLCGQGTDARTAGKGHPNVVGALTKPFTPEELFNAVRAALTPRPQENPAPPPAGPPTAAATTGRSRARLSLPPPPHRGHPGSEAAARIVFRGTTASFSLKIALQAAVETRHPGVLRFNVPAAPVGNDVPPSDDDSRATAMAPVEVYLRSGAVVLVTTRDPDLYGPLPAPFDGAADVLRREQGTTGCPPFLSLLAAGRMSDTEAWLATTNHGQRLFAGLWTQPRLDFEFERLAELPGFARDLPANGALPPAPASNQQGLDEDALAAVHLDDWLLGTLRRLQPANLPELADGHARFDGVPAYTREGYTTIHQLQLTDLEAAFARQVNGRTDLHTLAGHLGMGPASAFLLMFRFRSMGLMDLWPASALAPGPAKADRRDGKATNTLG